MKRPLGEEPVDTEIKVLTSEQPDTRVFDQLFELKCHESFRASSSFSEKKKLHCIQVALHILHVLSQKNLP